MSRIGNNVRTIREAAGLSRRQVGEWFKITERSVRFMENKKIAPPVDRLQVIADKIDGVALEDFLDDERAMKKAAEFLAKRLHSNPGMTLKVVQDRGK